MACHVNKVAFIGTKKNITHLCFFSFFTIFPFYASAALHFDPDMLSVESNSVADLTRFENLSQPPGEYLVDIYLNGNFFASRKVMFNPADTTLRSDSVHPPSTQGDVSKKANNDDRHDHTGLKACLTKNALSEMGVNITAYGKLASVPNQNCLSPGEYIPFSYTYFDFQKMRLDVSIPQAAIKQPTSGFIASEKWDEGITAFLLNYRVSGAENRGTFGSSRSTYLNINSGFNYGPWRLRNNSDGNAYNNNGEHHYQWTNQSTYLQRTLIPLRSELTVGDTVTDSDVYDAFAFRGIQIARDDNMYPDTQRGFAPAVHGTAHSNAKVTIRQHGDIIYTTFVSPGPFIINDLFPVSSGGDLLVTVTEADNTKRMFIVPFSSIPVLQRQGHMRYGIVAGQLHRSGYEKPAFMQGNLLWGLSGNMTAYGGTQLSSGYRSVALGAGINMGHWGALSTDITQSNALLSNGSHHDGQSVRFVYARSLMTVGTTLQLAGYRYSTKGFYNFEESAQKKMSGWDNGVERSAIDDNSIRENSTGYDNLNASKRERLQINITQRIAESGELFLSGSRQDYWNHAPTMTSLQTGLSFDAGKVDYSISYSYTKMSGQQMSDRSLYFAVTVPLSLWSSQDDNEERHQAWVTYNLNRDVQGNLTHQTNISGTALPSDNLDWSVSQGYSQKTRDSGDIALGYKGARENLSAGYGYSQHYKQLRYGASGGMAVHSEGVTFGESLGATNVLIAAPGAADVPVDSQNGLSTDGRGYSLIPYASVYRENRVALDISHLDNQTEIDDAVAYVFPTRGALVRARFIAHRGARVLMTIIHKGKPLPFGTTVSSSDNSSGLVGDGGKVYLSGLHPQGKLQAQWGSQPDQHCLIRYHIPDQTPPPPLTVLTEICR